MEKEFLYSKYITIKRKSELSLTLGLSERQIKIWFQNRRAKDRKTSRKQRTDNNSNSALRNPEFNDFENDSDASANEEDLSDMEEEAPKQKKSKKSLKASLVTSNINNKPSHANNISIDDLELIQKRQHQAYSQQVFNQTSGFNGAVFNSNISPGSVGTFTGYTHQLNSTPTYNHYFNQDVVSSSQAALGNNFDYQNCQYGGQTYAANSHGLEYSNANFNQAAAHDQYQQYYQQQHLLLNGASI